MSEYNWFVGKSTYNGWIARQLHNETPKRLYYDAGTSHFVDKDALIARDLSQDQAMKIMAHYDKWKAGRADEIRRHAAEEYRLRQGRDDAVKAVIDTALKGEG